MIKVVKTVAVLLLVVVSSGFGIQGTSSRLQEPTRLVDEVGGDWQAVSLENEEFSMATPVQPSVLAHSGDYTFVKDGERVLEERSYSGYADGFIFALRSYKASDPAFLLKDIIHFFRMSPIAEVKLNGSIGTVYQSDRKDYAVQNYSFVTKRHVYLLTLASRDANHPAIARFFASFKLGSNKSSVGALVPKSEDDSITSNINMGIVIKSKEATRKAGVVWKPEPRYTERARRKQVTGTVILTAILDTSGQVFVSAVLAQLPDGLTENAIEAAKNMRFLPAEKDGKPVSVQIQIEYNFNLY